MQFQDDMRMIVDVQLCKFSIMLFLALSLYCVQSFANLVFIYMVVLSYLQLLISVINGVFSVNM